MSEELNPCPFCGHHEMYFDHHVVQPDNLNGGMWRCVKCDSSGPDGDYWHDSEREAKLDAAKKWNTRHIPEGYALVPVEPTKAMIDDGMRVGDVGLELIYKAMIADAQDKK